MTTGPEHYREAERLLDQADAWMNADRGWKANLTMLERLAYRSADIAAAQAHATLATAAATALNDPDPNGSGMPEDDYNEWIAVTAVKS